MGTRKSRHNKGRKPFYKDHRQVAAHLLAHPRYPGCGYDHENGWYNTRLWWSEPDKFALEVLCEAEASLEGSADALGRKPSCLAHRARDNGITLPKEWAALIRPKYKPIERRVDLNYPYIIKSRPEHESILAVNAIIPKGIPDNMRSDMCQEILCAILEGRTTLEILKSRDKSMSYFIRKFYKDNYEQNGHAISFDAVDDNRSYDEIASHIAAREWREHDMNERRLGWDALNKTFQPPTQFDAVWQDQVGRHRLKLSELGQFFTHEEVEQMFDPEMAS